MTGSAIAAAARGLVGALYRHGGRDPATGLDCLGVVVTSFTAAGWRGRLPLRSTLHRRDLPDASQIAHDAGLMCLAGNTLTDGIVPGDIMPGDIMMVRCSPIQLHLLVATGDDRFVHAHAGLRRVVLSPRDPAWPIVARWRLPTRS